MRSLFLFALVLAAFSARGLAAMTVQATVDPQEVNIGDEATLTYTISGGSVEDFPLPPVDGLTVEANSTSSRIVMNGFQFSQSYSHTFLVVPNRAGTMIVPAFDIHDNDGKVVARAQALVLHVLGAGSIPSPPPSTPAVASPSGPVTLPPGMSSPDDQSTDQQPASNNGSTSVNVPTDSDGQQARVFDVITPQTTTAYVGEAVPLRIESFIRADANAQQDSLPTLIGSDFLMNNLSLRPSEDGVNVGNMEYIRDSWLTAIEAPRAGDFPLQGTRDTYWTKSAAPLPDDPVNILFGRQQAQLLHKDIVSNKLVMHILPLPNQGKPPGFSGAIGKFQVSGNATPVSVGVGEPVTLRFTVTGEGNFDYVRSPALAADSAWKPYVATSKINYQEESHTQAMKIFEQAIIPRRNGTVQLPTATFSYFDPDTKQYVNVPVSLPPITVTGPMPETTAGSENALAGVGSPATALPSPGPEAAAFAPNRLSLGSLTTNLAPAYRQGWFWILQALLLLVIGAGTTLALIQPRRDTSRDDCALREASIHHEEEAMDEAAHKGDALTFFAAARHFVQLQLAERWKVAPNSLTLAEISRHDTALAETVAPLFHEADNVIYSGASGPSLDLPEWNRRVREMLQPARV